MATLKATPKYFNTYEGAHDILSKSNKWFDEQAWQMWANKGELDQYITVLANTDKITDPDKFYKEYNYEFGDTKTKVAALYNEVLADRTNTEEVRERYVTDANGNYMFDENNNPITEKYKASDYDYYKSILKNYNDQNYEKYLVQREEERKQSMNGFAKVMSTVAAVPGEIVVGLTNQIDNLLNSLFAISEGVDAALKNENIADAFVKANAGDQLRIFEQLGLQKAITEFEGRYSYMRDTDGNYTDFGKYLGGICNTLGQMLPSRLLGQLAGSTAGALGGSASAVSTATQITSSLAFYQGITAGNVREIYNEMSKNGASVPSEAILSNATIKSALQYMVEIGLAKILGGSALDNLVFGRSVKGSLSSDLTKEGLKRLAGDFVEEGLEEVFQDTSDFLVDRAYMVMFRETFGEQFEGLTEFTAQSIADSFIIGGLASFAGSALNILTTRRKETANIKYDKNGNVVYDKNGNVVFEKLNKIASWEYGLDMESFVRNAATIQNRFKSLVDSGKGIDANSREAKELTTAYTEMYASFRILSSIYNEIGAERFNRANAVLHTITSMINDGKFTQALGAANMFSSGLMKELDSMELEARKSAVEKLVKANMTKVDAVVERKDDLANLSLSDDIKKEIEDLFKGDETVKKVVVTKDGNNVVISNDTIFVPIKYAKSASGQMIYETIAEQELVENILKGDYRGLPLDTILSIFKECTGDDEATTEEAVYNLVFNDSFFRIVLSTANKDTYQLLSSLITIEQNTIPKNLRKAAYKNKISTVIKNMKASLFDYLINQPYADADLDFFTADEKRKIKASRWCKDLYNRVINDASFKKLSDNDWRVLESRVNSLPVNQNEKDRILKNLHSTSSSARTGAMNRIAAAYEGVFKTKYDGTIYMPDTNIPNRTFNMFLQKHGLTLQTLNNTNIDESTKANIVETFGEVNENTVLQYRQQQFIDDTNNKFVFMFGKDGRPGVYEAKTNKQVGYSNYSLQAPSLLSPTALDKRTIIEKGNKSNYLVRELLNSSVDTATASYLSIDNVISDPSLLSEKHQAAIKLKYGDVTIENTFLYLRDYFVNETKGTRTVIALSDGTYAFGNVLPMKSILKQATLSIDKNTKISQLIKSEYLYGRLADISIRSTDRNIVAEYDSVKNVIYINKKSTEYSNDMLTFAFLHEFQHAIQVENSMNIGMNARWISSNHISESARNKIISDVKKHRPELFENVQKENYSQVVNDFVYFSSGESTAIGIDASTLIDFYPTIVRDTNRGTVVQFPWGNSYNITGGLPMSFMATFDMFEKANQLLSREDKEKYNAYIVDSYKPVTIESTKLYEYVNGMTVEQAEKVILNIFATFEESGVASQIQFAEDMYLYFSSLKKYFSQKNGFNESDASAIADFIEELSRAYLPKSALRIKLDTLNTHTLTSDELIKDYERKKYAIPNKLKSLSDNIIKRFDVISKFVVPNIKTVGWMYKKGARQYDVMGFQILDMIRYHTYNMNESRSTDSEYVEALTHEVLHYLTGPYLSSSILSDLYKYDKTAYNKTSDIIDTIDSLYNLVQKEDSEYYFINLKEFICGALDEDFINYLDANYDFDKVTKQMGIIIDDKINTLSDLLINLVTKLVDSINVYDLKPYLLYSRHAKYSAEYKSQLYSEENGGVYTKINFDSTNGFYRVDDNGNRVYEYEPNYFKTSLDSKQNMSLKAFDDTEEQLLKNINNEIKNIRANNANIKPEQIVEKLADKFPFMPTEILQEAVNDYSKDKTKAKTKTTKSISTEAKEEIVKTNEEARKELAELNKSLEGNREESKVKKQERRNYIEPEEGETVIKNTTGNGKWIEKRAMVDESGEFIRNKDGKIIYTYKYESPKRYVSQKKGAGTNLEKFGYSSKYKREELSQELQDFIVNATEDIDSRLWEKVKSGKIKTYDVMDYLRDADDIDDKTFKLINDSFFHNTKIKTFKELENYVLSKTPKYYAVRAIANKLGYGNILLSNTNPNLLEQFLEIINKDSVLKNTYDKIYERYYTYKGEMIDISDKNLRRLWLTYFDGSVEAGGYLATIAKTGSINKWLITGEGSTKARRSLNQTVGKKTKSLNESEGDMEVQDVYEDENASRAFDEIFYSTTREERIEDIMRVAAPKYVKRLLEKGVSKQKAEDSIKHKWEQLRKMSDIGFAKQYAKIVRSMSEEEINDLFKKQLVAESAGLDITKMSDEELKRLDTVSNIVVDKGDRPSSAMVNNIHSMTRTIKANLSEKDKARFLKENGDLFDKNLNIKDDVIKKKGVYLETDKLRPIEDRVRQLSKDVRALVYKSKKALDLKRKMEKEIRSLNAANEKLLNDLANVKSKKGGAKLQAITYEISDEKITVDTTRNIPEILKKLLETEFKDTAKSTTKYLIDGDERHIRTSFKTFADGNAELLRSLSQADVDEITDFYLNSEIIPTTNKAREYVSIEIFLMTYIVAGNKTGLYILSEEQLSQLTKRLETIISISGMALSNWNQVMQLLKPVEYIVQSLASSAGINIAEADVEMVLAAIKTGDIKKITDAKEQMYSNTLAQSKTNKTKLLDRIWKFERLAMLSGPGTAIRNQVSNVLVTAGNISAEQISKGIFSVLEKLLPNKKFHKEGQYKIVGTQVTSEVQSFIKREVIDNGLLSLISDGLNKYDTRKNEQQVLTSEESLAKIISNSVVSKVFQNTTFSTPAFAKIQKIVLKGLSDDRSINKAAIRYFGKMLTEDNIDLSNGFSDPKIIDTLAEAYNMAARDYMHKQNFINKIETLIKQQAGDGAYFMYKQLFPFASASMNWFLEGLMYTPIGLVKGIVNLAKLENTIARMDEKRQKGDLNISSRWAEYIAKRNIGKGVIGSIGLAIGIALASAGLAGIDEEDDKYKLFVRMGDETVYVDISNLFGTQGILLGICLATPINGGDWLKVLSASLDTLFADSTLSDVYNTFRYSTSFGDWLLSQPFAFLNQMIPNFLKTFTSIATKYKVKYSSGVLGKIEKLALSTIPGLAYAFPKHVDPYTGENQVTYKMWFMTGLVNKLSPLKVYPYNVSDIEKEAIANGVRKSELTGNYKVNDEDVKLSAEDKDKLNEYYGKLNNKLLTELMSNKKTYKVWDEKQNKYVEIKYKAMTESQKKTVIERIMNNNGQIAKIYILTSSGGWKYYADDSEYLELKKLGLKNIYKKTNKLEGFVKN